MNNQSKPVPNAPPDVDEQHALWGANCGPTALAAILGTTVAAVRPLVEAAQGGRFKGYMNAGHLIAVLHDHGRTIRRTECTRGEIRWPIDQGLCVLQFDGPWCEPGVNPRARYRYTHTIAAANGWIIYDGNARVWLHRRKWEQIVMAELVRETKRATGWYMSTVIDVE